MSAKKAGPDKDDIIRKRVERSRAGARQVKKDQGKSPKK